MSRKNITLAREADEYTNTQRKYGDDVRATGYSNYLLGLDKPDISDSEGDRSLSLEIHH